MAPWKLQDSLQNTEVNLGPWFKAMLMERPQNWKTWQIIHCAVSLADGILGNRMWLQWLNWSTMVITKVLPPEGETPVIKSVEIWNQGRWGTGRMHKRSCRGHKRPAASWWEVFCWQYTERRPTCLAQLGTLAYMLPKRCKGLGGHLTKQLGRMFPLQHHESKVIQTASPMSNH